MASGAFSTAEIADALKRARELAASARSEDGIKRPHEDEGVSPPKKMNLAGNPITALGGNPGLEPCIIEQFQVPDSCVGLIIGRGGESITQIQNESGCRIQMSQNKSSGSPSDSGSKSMRCCTLTGAPHAVEKAKQLIQNIVSRAGESLPPMRTGANASPMLGTAMMHPGLGIKPITTEIMIPATKCGLIIGKGGETIKQLQERTGVKMMMVQDTCQPTGMPKPLRITGEPTKVELAKQLIEEVMNSKSDNVLFADEYGSMTTDKRVGEVIVPRHAVGVIIGKNGDTIRKLTTESGAKIQFRPDESHTAPERTAIISGTVEQIQKATQLITDLVTKSGGSDADVFYMHVPANKTGLVIGKGGETIKQINSESGARVELSRDPAPNEWEKVFVIRGTPYQINHAQHLIRIKVGDVAPGTPVPAFAGAPDQSSAFPFSTYAAAAANATGASPNVSAALQDPTAAWAAYYAYYQQSGAFGQAYPMSVAATGNSATATAAGSGSSAAAVNPQTGQPDYSAQWAEYYRSLGLHDHANMIEQSARAAQQQQQQQQQTQQQSQQAAAAAQQQSAQQLTTASPTVQSYPYAQNQSPYAFGQQAGAAGTAYQYPAQY